MKFKHGDHVVIVNDNEGASVAGTLHLPDRVLYSGAGEHSEPQSVDEGHFAVHTIVKADGSKYRTEGRLRPGTV